MRFPQGGCAEDGRLQDFENKFNMVVNVQCSRGEDIDAACGQLATNSRRWSGLINELRTARSSEAPELTWRMRFLPSSAFEQLPLPRDVAAVALRGHVFPTGLMVSRDDFRADGRLQGDRELLARISSFSFAHLLAELKRIERWTGRQGVHRSPSSRTSHQLGRLVLSGK